MRLPRSISEILEPGWQVKWKYRPTAENLLSAPGPSKNAEAAIDARLAKALEALEGGNGSDPYKH